MSKNSPPFKDWVYADNRKTEKRLFDYQVDAYKALYSQPQPQPSFPIIKGTMTGRWSSRDVDFEREEYIHAILYPL